MKFTRRRLTLDSFIIEAGAVRALRAAALHERVLVVEAGPGWGKTTAVRSAFPDALYVEVPAGARAGAFEVALLVSLGLSAADAGSIVARLDVDATSVLRAVLASQQRRAIIIDDIQRLDAIGSGLIEALVEAQTVRLVIVGRTLSVLPIGTWVARGFVGMPFGPDVLALRPEHVAELFAGLPAGEDLLRDVTSTYAGWPLAGAIAVAALRRGDAAQSVREQLADGIASIAASVLDALAGDARARLIESALRAAHGLSPTIAGLLQIRALALPESQSGLHELFVSAVLKNVSADVRASVARGVGEPNDDPSGLYALLSAEAPDALYDRAWTLLAPLHDRYDRATLERMAADSHVDSAAATAARSFLHVFASQFERAAAEAEPVLETIAAKDPHTVLRVARALVHAGRAETCVELLEKIDGDDASMLVRRDCLLGYINDDPSRVAAAIERATRAGDVDLIAFASIHSSVLALHAGSLDAAEGLAARGEDAARAAASVLLEARALKIRYGIATLRAKLDVAAVHVGRLVSLQELIADPNERASDLVAAFEIEVLAGRPARAAGYDRAIRKIGHGWLDMETYVVCQAIVDAWEGLLLSGADRLSAFASVAQPSAQRLPLALGAFLSAAGDAPDRAAELLRRLAATPGAIEPFAQAHSEMAASFAALAECLLNRQSAAANRLRFEAQTAFGAVFLSAARQYAAGSGASAYADAMRSAGFTGVATLIEGAGLQVERTPLSRTERSILSYLASGMDAPKIADLTGRSLHTIKNQRRSIISKLGAGNTVEAVAIARRLGLL
jgi:DNA-binding CsgD family transcriptional regulator